MELDWGWDEVGLKIESKAIRVKEDPVEDAEEVEARADSDESETEEIDLVETSSEDEEDMETTVECASKEILEDKELSGVDSKGGISFGGGEGRSKDKYLKSR